jgi:uncharacterized protein (DUF2062 family)
LSHPRLWRFSRRSVAVGVALGVFFGLLIPIAQIPLAAGAAVALRANVPSAVVGTLVTNPVTFAPIYVFAHRLGAALLGEQVAADSQAVISSTPADTNVGWWSRLWSGVTAVGKPLLVGLALLAASAGVAAYLLIMVVWRIKTAVDWKRRRRGGAHVCGRD